MDIKKEFIGLNIEEVKQKLDEPRFDIFKNNNKDRFLVYNCDTNQILGFLFNDKNIVEFITIHDLTEQIEF